MEDGAVLNHDKVGRATADIDHRDRLAHPLFIDYGSCATFANDLVVPGGQVLRNDTMVGARGR